MFDRFVVVDWSASSTPTTGRDSIWIAVADADGLTLSNPATRARAEAELTACIGDRPRSRTLVAVDVSLGYPAGTAAALGLADWAATADRLEREIVDDDRNRNNRFDVAARWNRELTGGPAPFWGCPPAAAGPWLTPTRPPCDTGPSTWRWVERVLREQGRRPFSSWQLMGAGAVGSQSLVGIPMVARLARRFGDRLSVWPFTTGLAVPDSALGSVVVAEVWPSLWPVEVGPGEVRDAVQVRSTAQRLRRLDRDGQLEALFRPDIAPTPTDRYIWCQTPDVTVRRDQVVGEEGWILGVEP